MNNQIIFLLGSFTLYNRMEQCLQKVQPGASFTFGKQHQPSTCQDICFYEDRVHAEMHTVVIR